MDTRYAAGARPLCPNDLNLSGSIHRFHPGPFQFRRSDPCYNTSCIWDTALAADWPTPQDEIAEIGTRPYKGLVGARAWLALGTRPDIGFAASSPARFGHNSGRVHWDAARRVRRYPKVTRGDGLRWEVSPLKSPLSRMRLGKSPRRPTLD